ncbi:MAG: aconitase X catalytic domain-containing protein [Candidatus Thermoplasmatota archaeon]|nr:aconitase X catalytic domain-containing protein [Candidatus Thermoplasmatota archaeon]
MYLTKEEESILEGEKGEGPAKAMELLVALGKIYQADKLIPIQSAQIAGVSYKTMGDAGLEFVKDFGDKEGAKVSVRSMLNPAGMDLESEGYEPEDFRIKQKELIDAYEKMGVKLSCTCTPYLAGNRPDGGEHLAWSESSAVSFANSVLGARTNREGGPSALMAAIIGKTPNYGLHLKENRRPDVVYEVKDEVSPSLLGYLVGGEVGEKVPYFRGLSISEDGLKSLGAAMAATGSVAMYHVEDVTLEAGDFSVEGLEKIEIDTEDIEGVKNELKETSDPDVIVIGCPHLSDRELKKVADLLEGKQKKEETPDLYIYTSRKVKDRSQEAVKIIEKFGKVITDTCMVVSPLEEKYRVAATNSGKAAAYLPKLADQKVIHADLKTLMEMVV